MSYPGSSEDISALEAAADARLDDLPRCRWCVHKAELDEAGVCDGEECQAEEREEAAEKLRDTIPAPPMCNDGRVA